MKLKGIITKIIFENKDNGYLIGLFKVKEIVEASDDSLKNKSIIVTGLIFDAKIEEYYIIDVLLVKHPRHGLQYQIEQYELCAKETKNEIVTFLSSGLFRGVGEKTAEDIYNVYKEKTMEKILEGYHNLSVIKGISEKKAIDIFENAKKYSLSHEIIRNLTTIGFSMKKALSIYNTFKDNTNQIIDNNIYDLINNVDNIYFNEVDKIALNMGISLLDDKRIKAVLLNIISIVNDEIGNTYAIMDDILKHLDYDIRESLSREKLEYYLYDLHKNNQIVIVNEKYFLKRVYDAENYIANRISRLITKKKNNIFKKSDINTLESQLNVSYNKEQKEAILKALNNNLTIITGGPGTGKTTIVKAIVKMFHQEMKGKISLLAPTGRASKRLMESTGYASSTIHRFLKWNKERDEFSINEYNKDDSTFVIIDEFSMVDTLLFDSLLKGLEERVQIVLVGDYNQLPSVACGQLLKDFIMCEEIETITLNELYRQSSDSYIISLAKQIKEEEITDELFKQKSDYNFINNVNINASISDICSKAIAKGYTSNNMQILAPMYGGNGGIDYLNISLQELFNPPSLSKKEYAYGEVIYRIGDKVIQLVNMVDDNVFNGDIGYIINIIPPGVSDSKKNEVYIDFDSNIVMYTPSELSNIKHAYAISVHKSQGSEFDNVIVPISPSHKRMLYNRLIYTAVTRAKKSLILVGHKESFIYAITNDYDSLRKTNLISLIQKSIKK